MAATQSDFIRIPAEIRVLVYSHLLDNGGNRVIEISSEWPPKDDIPGRRRSRYYIEQTPFNRAVTKTTYRQSNGSLVMYPAITAVNRKIRDEATHYLYSKHSFAFHRSSEALSPFLNDLTLQSKMFLKEITVRKSIPGSPQDPTGAVWSSICKSLQTIGQLSKLRIIVEGKRPRYPFAGPQSFSVSDLRLLYATRQECLEWVRDLIQVQCMDEVEIIADIKTMAQPDSSATLMLAALSESIDSSLAEFLQAELAVSVNAGCSNSHYT